jgi:hypothetical protein
MKESHVKCTRLSALIAATSAKYRLSQIRADQSTAENVGQKEEAEHVEADTKKANTDRPLTILFQLNFSSFSSSHILLLFCFSSFLKNV